MIWSEIVRWIGYIRSFQQISSRFHDSTNVCSLTHERQTSTLTLVIQIYWKQRALSSNYRHVSVNKRTNLDLSEIWNILLGLNTVWHMKIHKQVASAPVNDSSVATFHSATFSQTFIDNNYKWHKVPLLFDANELPVPGKIFQDCYRWEICIEIRCVCECIVALCRLIVIV